MGGTYILAATGNPLPMRLTVAVAALVVCAFQLWNDAGTVRLLFGFRTIPLAFALLVVDIVFAELIAAGADQVFSNPMVWVGTGGSVPALLGSKKLSIKNREIDVNFQLVYVTIVPLLKDRLGHRIANSRLDRAERVAQEADTRGIKFARVYRHMKEQVQGNVLAGDKKVMARLEQIEAVRDLQTSGKRKIARLVDFMYQWGMGEMVKKTRTGIGLP